MKAPPNTSRSGSHSRMRRSASSMWLGSSWSMSQALDFIGSLGWRFSNRPRYPAASVAAMARYGFTSTPGTRFSSRRLAGSDSGTRMPQVRLS